MWNIESIQVRRILNSHVEFTNEFEVRLTDGCIGIGASPEGETISIYEDKLSCADPCAIVREMRQDGYIGSPLEQVALDNYLAQKFSEFGRNNCYAISLAFLNAVLSTGFNDAASMSEDHRIPPNICFNILNGGWHAYTNPVLSDFTEYLLVSRSEDFEDVMQKHNEIQRAVSEALHRQTKTIVAGNTVSRFDTADNRECLEFVLGIQEKLGLSDEFDLMVDASAGDLWTEEGYRLQITDGSLRSGEGFCEYWMNLLDQYPLRFLEDPFAELDFASWSQLATSQNTCYLIGDNLYSSDASRIEEGALHRRSHGVIIKPNQAGTVTATRRAIDAVQRSGQIAITSHRSISTESPFVATLTCNHGIKYIKIGPLLTDYSSVIRLNEIIRLTGATQCLA